MSQVAVELVEKIFGDLKGRAILLVGAGKMGALSAKALAVLGISPGVIHLNEGHSAFASLELVRRRMECEGISFDEAMRRVAEMKGRPPEPPVAPEPPVSAPAGFKRGAEGAIEEVIPKARSAVLWIFFVGSVSRLGNRA